MRKVKIFIVICILLAFSATIYGSSYELPEPNYDFYVYDEAKIIDNSVRDYIIDVNRDLYKKTGVEIVVATINSLEGIDINSYATSLFEKWKIGGKDQDNGMLLLIVPEDGEVWIEVGYGLEGVFPDSKVKRIIDNYIFTYFAVEDYSNGILSGFNKILDGVEDEYNISLDRMYEDNPIMSNTEEDTENKRPNIIMIIGIIILLIFDFSLFRGRITLMILHGISRGSSGGSSSRGRTSGGGGRSGGGGAGGKWK